MAKQKIKKVERRPCPVCGDVLVATRVLKYKGKGEDGPGHSGMFWICSACGYREPVRRRK